MRVTADQIRLYLDAQQFNEAILIGPLNIVARAHRIADGPANLRIAVQAAEKDRPLPKGARNLLYRLTDQRVLLKPRDTQWVATWRTTLDMKLKLLDSVGRTYSDCPICYGPTELVRDGTWWAWACMQRPQCLGNMLITDTHLCSAIKAHQKT